MLHSMTPYTAPYGFSFVSNTYFYDVLRPGARGMEFVIFWVCNGPNMSLTVSCKERRRTPTRIKVDRGMQLAGHTIK